MSQKDRFLPVHRFLPPTGLPASHAPISTTREWLFSDDPESYKQRGGHPVYGEKDISYHFNSRGYRCPEFDTKADLRILAVGCSYVLGTGVAQDHLFHERFTAQLKSTVSKSIVHWNIGVSAASNDHIIRLLTMAVPRLDPHLVLLNFTHGTRREYVTIENRLMNYVPSYVPPNDEIAAEILGHLRALTSPNDDILNFFRNYKMAELVLAGRPWIFSHIMPKEFEPLADQMDLSRFAGRLNIVDRARDGVHPGPESHKQLAALYWNKFQELGGPNLFVTSRPAPGRFSENTTPLSAGHS